MPQKKPRRRRRISTVGTRQPATYDETEARLQSWPFAGHVLECCEKPWYVRLFKVLDHYHLYCKHCDTAGELAPTRQEAFNKWDTAIIAKRLLEL